MPTCGQTKAVIEGWGTMTVLTGSIKQRHYYPNIKEPWNMSDLETRE